MHLVSLLGVEAIESQFNTEINKPRGLGVRINDSDPFDFDPFDLTPLIYDPFDLSTY